MRIGVITRHAITNYGSLLQAVATQEIVEQLGYECRIIDYIRNDENYKTREKTSLKNKPFWNKSFVTRFIYLVLRLPEGYFVGLKFEKEREKLLKLTKRYSSLEELCKEPPLADVYMTGSDQVWGPVECGAYDYVYCLNFTDDNAKRISYAASFGRIELGKEILNRYGHYLSRYSHISVRETSAITLVESIGLNAEQVLDPTLLLDKEYWKQFFKPIKKKKYILIYQINNDDRLGDFAEKLSKKMGLPLIRISAAMSQLKRPGKLVYCPSMGEFLSYIDNAECLVTDSFHGTAFAINFNTQFVEVLPNNKTGTRNISVLELTNLTERIVNNPNDVSKVLKKIDFAKVNSILEKNRARSIACLKKMIEV